MNSFSVENEWPSRTLTYVQIAIFQRLGSEIENLTTINFPSPVTLFPTKVLHSNKKEHPTSSSYEYYFDFNVRNTRTHGEILKVLVD